MHGMNMNTKNKQNVYFDFLHKFYQQRHVSCLLST
jgi:hypothetical protein